MLGVCQVFVANNLPWNRTICSFDLLLSQFLETLIKGRYRIEISDGFGFFTHLFAEKLFDLEKSLKAIESNGLSRDTFDEEILLKAFGCAITLEMAYGNLSLKEKNHFVQL